MRRPAPRHQSGYSLIEGLVAILVFSIGVLGLLDMQGTAVRFSTDARYRSEAAFLADQLVARITVSDPASLGQFSHHPTAAANGASCAPQGSASTNAVLEAWLDDVSAALPGAGAERQQVIVDTASNTVTINLCWEPPGASVHRHQVVNTLQW